jgi:hypothetical protein
VKAHHTEADAAQRLSAGGNFREGEGVDLDDVIKEAGGKVDGFAICGPIEGGFSLCGNDKKAKVN